jgi:hypothetical protein
VDNDTPAFMVDNSFVDPSEQGAVAQQGLADPTADKKLWREFYMKPKLNTAKSRAAGREIWEEVPYIRLGQPGDKDIVDRPFWDDPLHAYSDRSRFGEDFEKWKTNRDAKFHAGTPLSMLALTQPPILDAAQVKEFEYFRIVTAEQLVGASDEVGTKFRGFSQLREKVRKYLDLQLAAAPQERLEAELEQRDVRIASLAESNAAMAEMLTKMQGELERLKGPGAAPKKQKAKPATSEAGA